MAPANLIEFLKVLFLRNMSNTTVIYIKHNRFHNFIFQIRLQKISFIIQLSRVRSTERIKLILVALSAAIVKYN